jgi:hypothetical protein
LDTAQQETAKQASPHGQTAPSDGKTGASVADEATLVPPDQIEERVQEEGKSPDHAHP